MKNTTNHQCEISCSISITCYTAYMYHLPTQIERLSFTLPDYYYYACVDVLPKDTLN